MNQQEDKILTVKEVSTYLNVGKSTVYKLAKKGDIGRKVGGKWRFSRLEVDEWMRKRPLVEEKAHTL